MQLSELVPRFGDEGMRSLSSGVGLTVILYRAVSVIGLTRR